MKHILTLFFLCYLVQTKAQDDFHQKHIDTNDPVNIPSSPEATAFGKYGDLPLNSSTGQMNFSVPIHTIETDGQSWPISLQYNYSGLVLEGKPSLMGLGWNLSANGAVVREIRGLPDEQKDVGYYGLNSPVQTIINDYKTSGDMDLTDLRDKFYKGAYDSQVDKYTVNVNGMNFSFKISENDEAVYLSKHNYEVEIFWNPAIDYSNQVESFVVTDDQGIIYTFSEIERSIPYLDEEFLLNPITSWNIKEVEYPNGKSIQFNYTPNDFVSYDFSARGAALYTDIQEDLSSNPIFFSPIYKEFSSLTTVRRQILNNISFDGGSINFSRILNSGRDLYQSIVIRNENNDPITTYNFSYVGQRDNLASITKNNEHFYKFEYHGPNTGESALPAFMQSQYDKALAQDRWKYYNGAPNTSALSIPASNHTADSDPHFANTRKGALKKIIYPTRGNTEVFYEQNQIKTNNIFKGGDFALTPLNEQLKVSLQLDGAASTNQIKETTVTYTFKNPTVATISHFASTNDLSSTHLDMRMEKIGPCPYSTYFPGSGSLLPMPAYSYEVLAPYLRQEIERLKDVGQLSHLDSEIPPLCPTLNFIWDPAGIGGGPNTTSTMGDSNGRVLILPGTYEFKLTTRFNGYSEAYGEIIINFNRAQAEEEPSPYINENVGGIRVSSLRDCSDDKCKSRYFDYDDDKEYSTGLLNIVPIREFISSWKTSYSNSPGVTYVELRDYSTDTYTSPNPNFGTPVYYNKVTEYGSGGKTKGYSETVFESPTDIYGDKYPRFPKGIDLDKGRVNNTTLYKAIQSPDGSYTFDPVQKNEKKYIPYRGQYQNDQDSNPEHPLSFIVARKKDHIINFNQFGYDLYPGTPAGREAVKNLYHLVEYKELDLIHKIWQEKTTSTLAGETVTQQTDYAYESDYNQLEKQVTTDSQQNTLEVNFKYPYNLIEDPVNQAMVDSNQITNPVEIVKLKNGNTISKQKIDFKLVENGYKHDVIYGAKGANALEARVRYKYDSSGNVTEVTIPDNLTAPEQSSVNNKMVSYIWGYNDMYPIAKLENVPYETVSGEEANLKALSNIDFDRTIGNVGEEGNLRTALDNLRVTYPEAQITTYTYDPFIGVTSMTDPRGYVTYYHYNGLNRLSHIKDKDSKMLQEFEYAFRSSTFANPDGSYPPLEGTIEGLETVQAGTDVVFTAVPSGGSGNFSQQWYKDGVLLSESSILLQENFSVGGTFTISLKITDQTTGNTETITKQVDAYEGLSTFTLSANTTQATVGSTIVFSSSGISGGLGTLTYEWYIDNQLQSFEGSTDFNTTFNIAGSYTVRLVVKDGGNDTLSGDKIRVYIHNGLSTPTLTANSLTILSGENITFTPANISGGTTLIYKWYLDGQLLTFDQNAPYQHLFGQSGVYEVKFKVEDTTLGLSEEATVNVSVYNNLSLTGISTSATDILVGQSLTFPVPTVSGGSSNLGYAWSVNGTVKSTSLANFTYSSFNTAGNYTVKFKVTDAILGITKESSMIISVYNPLSAPSLTSSATHIVKNTAVDFTTSNIGQGSGSRNYEWYVTYGSGNEIKQTYTGQSNFVHTGFNQVGTYVIKFKVIDNELTGHSKETTRTINVYEDIVAGSISAPDPVTLLNNATFNINPTGGSGNYSYYWTLNPSTGANINFTTKSFTHNMDYNFYGTLEVTCVVTDNLTGATDTATKDITVNGLPGLILKQRLEIINENQYYEQYTIRATVQNGSGDYTYKWYNGTTLIPSTGDNTALYLDCANDTDSIRLEITDNQTSLFKVNTRVYTFSHAASCDNSGNQQ